VILDTQRLWLARSAPGRRMIIAAVVIILVNLVMMITLAHLQWFGRAIAVVGMIFLALVIFVSQRGG
jgi:drug/metabolite transporter superfamily protein YnfA